MRQSTNTVLHPWLKAERSAILATLPEPPVLSPEANRQAWTRWQEGLSVRITLPQELPPLRMLLVWDNLSGDWTPSLVRWLCAHRIMPLSTPLGGSWLNMAASIPRIRKRRARAGQHPTTPEPIVTWLEATARGWNRAPTPFGWGGKRHRRRQRARARRHAVRGSGACPAPASHCRGDAPHAPKPMSNPTDPLASTCAI